MRRATSIGVTALTVVGVVLLWALVAWALDPRCEKRPSHPSCQVTTTTTATPTTTTSTPSGITTTTVVMTTTTDSPTTTGTPVPSTTTIGPTTTTIQPPPPGSLVISVVGDVGTWPHSAGAVATAADSDVLFVVGDFSYGGSAPEEVWCDFMKGVLGDEFPIELLAGNHESDSGDSGFVRNYTSCLPDRLGSVGDYGVQYSLDLGPLTFIGISPDLKIDKYTYTYGEGTPERAWLENAADAARASGDWVMIGLHKLCISVGYKSCQTGEELANWMVANADVIVSGHEHTYERTRPLQCVTVESYDPACVSDEGTIWVINGTGGRNWWVKPDDPEASYFASVMGNARRTDWGYGTSRFVVTEDEITGSFLCSGTCSFTDSFVISR